MILTQVTALLRPATVDVSDLTTAKRSGTPYWSDPTTVVIPFATEPSGAEQIRIRRRLMTRSAAHEAQVTRYVTALAKLAANSTTSSSGSVVVNVSIGSTPAAAATDAIATLVRLLAEDRISGIDAPPTF